MFIPTEQGRKLHDQLKTKSFTPIPDASHIVHEDALAALLGSILKSI